MTTSTNKTIVVLPNQPPDMPVSCCKFWGLDLGAGCNVQRSAFDRPSGMDKAGGFRHDKMDYAAGPPAGDITEKVEQLQWRWLIP
jgi:hypothetical protein